MRAPRVSPLPTLAPSVCTSAAVMVRVETDDAELQEDSEEKDSVLMRSVRWTLIGVPCTLNVRSLVTVENDSERGRLPKLPPSLAVLACSARLMARFLLPEVCSAMSRSKLSLERGRSTKTFDGRGRART